MINQPESYDEENFRWEVAEDRKDTRQNALLRFVQLIWFGMVSFVIVAALRYLHEVW